MLRSLYCLVATSVLLVDAVAADPAVFTIKTIPAQMRYDVAEMQVAPGQEIKLVFENPDDMPHNIVFFQPGTDVIAVCNKQMEKPEEALKRNWLPEDPRLWLHSKLLNPKEREELVFKAPEKPGTYPYVCTMPGHAMIMNGKLNVFEQGPKLSGLRFQLYLGDWKQLPDFTKLTPHREGEVPENLIQLKLDDYKNQFGVVYTAKLTAPKDGEYTFALACDDGARLSVNGKKIVDHDGIHPSSTLKEGKVRLKKGDHDFRLEYFQGTGEAELYVGWRGDSFTATPLSAWLHPQWKGGVTTKKKDDTTGMPLAVTKEPVIYRNFIEGGGNRGIGVGFPGGMNVVWSADSMNVGAVWRGAFIDAARHWKDRGGGHQPPAGYDVVRLGDQSLPFATEAEATAEWPKLPKGGRAPGYRWKGYELDARRIPTFHYEWNGLKVAERYEAEGDAIAGTGKLTRIVRIEGSIPQGLRLRIGKGLQPTGAAFVDSATKCTITAPGAELRGKEISVAAQPEIRVTYAWPNLHGAHAPHAH